jgi:hypothetical protein
MTGASDPALGVEIAGLSVEAAQGVHARLGKLRNRLNVYRGHVLDVGVTPMGAVALEFGAVSQPPPRTWSFPRSRTRG